MCVEDCPEVDSLRLVYVPGVQNRPDVTLPVCDDSRPCLRRGQKTRSKTGLSPKRDPEN